MSDNTAFDSEVDASGLNCPLPILRAKKALASIASGQVLKITATDPGSRRDFEVFARQTGHELLQVERGEKNWTFYLRRR